MRSSIPSREEYYPYFSRVLNICNVVRQAPTFAGGFYGERSPNCENHHGYQTSDVAGLGRRLAKIEPGKTLNYAMLLTDDWAGTMWSAEPR